MCVYVCVFSCTGDQLVIIWESVSDNMGIFHYLCFLFSNWEIIFLQRDEQNFNSLIICNFHKSLTFDNINEDGILFSI